MDAESGIVEDVCSVDVTGRWGEIERRRGTTPEPPSDGDDGGRSGKAVRGVVVRQEGG